MKKSCRKKHQRLAPDPVLILLNCRQKNLSSPVLSNPVPFNGQSYQKQKGSGAQSLFKSQNKFRKIPLFVILSNQVWWCNVNSFWVIAKIISANLCKSIPDIINYSTSTCPFESGKCGKEEKKLQKFEYLENKRSFLDEIKNIFHSF